MEARGPARAPSRPGQLPLLLGFAAYGYLLMGFDGVQRPYLREAFGLDDAGIALLVALLQAGTFGSFLLLWQADRLGRRWLLLLVLALTPPLALGSALAPGLLSFAACQVALTALSRSVFGIVPVMLTEDSDDASRPRAQAWFGVVSILGATAGLILLSVVLRGDFRMAWALAALPILAFPWVRRALRETGRFERGADERRERAVQLWHVFEGPWRRRAVGLLVASTLRGAAVIAVMSWTYDHAIRALELGEALAAGLSLGATLLGLLGVPLGARLASRWGRRPTVVLGSTVSLGAGVAYFWVPADAGPWLIPLLATALVVSRMGLNVFSVGDRLVDTELFPTRLRATYNAWARLGDTLAGVGGNLALGALAPLLGGLVPSIALLAAVCFVPSLALFLWVVPETRGLALDEAALEG